MTLRYDKVALRFLKSLRTNLEESVPAGSLVVVTVTAPIWQSSKTSTELTGKVLGLLRAKRKKAKLTINRNCIQVRVLSANVRRGPKVIGFVHNPDADADLLFEVAQAVLASFSL